jgi:hypothetical protein
MILLRFAKDLRDIADDLDAKAKLNAPPSRGSSREDRRGAFLTLRACERSFSGR